MPQAQLQIDDFTFPIKEATFRYIVDGNGGWEFTVKTDESPNLDDDHLLAGYSPQFSAEGDPIPLENRDDLTGSELYLESPFDNETGEVYFTLYVFEHGDLTHLKLQFTERKGDKYHMFVTASIPAGSVLKHDAKLAIDTWIQRLPDGSYEDGD